MTRAAFLALAAGLAAAKSRPKPKRDTIEVCSAEVGCVPFTVRVRDNHTLLVTRSGKRWTVTEL